MSNEGYLSEDGSNMLARYREYEHRQSGFIHQGEKMSIVSFPEYEMIAGQEESPVFQKTHAAQMHRGCWSPDSRKICYPHKDILWNYEIETGRSKILFSEFPVKPVRWR